MKRPILLDFVNLPKIFRKWLLKRTISEILQKLFPKESAK